MITLLLIRPELYINEVQYKVGYNITEVNLEAVLRLSLKFIFLLFYWPFSRKKLHFKQILIIYDSQISMYLL